jgi:hypothetical protein
MLYYHHVYDRGRSSETMILGLAFSHKKFFSYFYVVLLAAVKPENHKNFVTYFVLVLETCELLVTDNHHSKLETQSCLFTVVGCLKSEEKEPNSGFPESLIITPSHPCGGKLLLFHYSSLGVPASDIFKIRVATIIT